MVSSAKLPYYGLLTEWFLAPGIRAFRTASKFGLNIPFHHVLEKIRIFFGEHKNVKFVMNEWQMFEIEIHERKENNIGVFWYFEIGWE